MEQKIFAQKTKEEVLCDLRKAPDAYRSYLGLNEEWQELMGMFSEMLHELDRNTTRYMVDDMKEKIEQQGKTIVKLQGTVTAQREALAEKDMALASRDGTITEQQRTISEQKAALEAMETEIKRLMENQTTFNQD